MTRHTDARQIEIALAQDRAQLTNSLHALRNRMSVSNLTDDALDAVKIRVSRTSATIDHVTRRSPFAVAAVGAGLAWLAFGKRSSRQSTAAKPRPIAQWEDDGGPARPVHARPAPDMSAQVRSDRRIDRMVEDHPILTGTFLLGLGAAVGAALPRSKTEDHVFGPQRNRLLDQAVTLAIKAVARGAAKVAE